LKIVTVIRSNKATESHSTNNTQVTKSNSDISRINLQTSENSMFPSTRITSSIPRLKIPIIETTSSKMGVDFTPESEKQQQHFLISRLISEQKTGHTATKTPIFGDLLSSVRELERKIKSCHRLVNKKCTS